MFYPFPSRPIWYGMYKMEMNLKLLQRIFLYGVVIVNKHEQKLTRACYALILPIMTIFTLYVTYKTLRVAMFKHVWKFRISFLCYAYVELCLMYISATIFAIYYWVWGAFKDEPEHGTNEFTCIFFLYFFNHAPNLFFNLVNWSMCFMYLLLDRNKKSRMCCWNFSNYNVRAMCITMTTLVTVEKMTLFSMTWVTVVLIAKYERPSKCFVLLNPIFETLNITDNIKTFIWLVQCVLHIVPYHYSLLYLWTILKTTVKKYHYHEHSMGFLVEKGEPEQFGGIIISLALSIVHVAMRMVWFFMNDIYALYQYISPDAEFSEFDAFVRTMETFIKTVCFIIMPFQLLALFSTQENFQNTMIRYLDGARIFDVDFQKTLGGDTHMKIDWKPLSENLHWQARLYIEYLKARPFVWLYEEYYEFRKQRFHRKRMKLKQEKADRRLNRQRAIDRRRRAMGQAVIIQIDPPTDDDRVDTEVLFLETIRGMKETAV